MPRVIFGLLLVCVLSCGRTVPLNPGRLDHCGLSLEPRAIDFGDVRPDVPVEKPVVLRNEGDEPCVVEGVAVDEASDERFGLKGAGEWPRTLGPDDTVSVTVTFIGSASLPSERRGTLVIRSPTAAEPMMKVALSARLSMCLLTVSPNPLDFGNVILNATVHGQVGLTNGGTTPCEVSAIRLTPDTDANFTLSPQPLAFTVPPGLGASIRVSFAGRTSAPPHLRTGQVAFHSNDAAMAERSVPLSAYINTLCTEAGQYIYTVDNGGQFSRFDPRRLSYTDIAPLNCPTGRSPFSMNVDQNAVAWVVFSDGNLFRVDTATGQCSATSYRPGQAGFTTYGMGSMFDSRTGVDTLYLSGLESSSGAGTSPLGKLAIPSLTVTRLGTIPMDSVELAGTGDGQLWAFSPSQGASRAALARIDPVSGALMEHYRLPTVNSIGGWAIKFFGGAFYLFIGSDIWRVERSSLDPSRPQPLTPPRLVLTSPGRDIVGAGVSTCAPVQ